MATLNWRGSATNTDGGGVDSTPTFSIDIGAAASDRWVVVVIAGREPQLTGITVNGVSLPNIVNLGGGQHPVFIAWGKVTTGSGVVTVACSTTAGSASWAMSGCWTITGAGTQDIVLRDSDGGALGTLATTVGSFTLSTQPGDFVIAGTNCLTAGSDASVTWSQGTERTDFNYNTQAYSTMQLTADGTSEVVQATHAQAITNPAITIVALYPQAGAVTVTPADTVGVTDSVSAISSASPPDVLPSMPRGAHLGIGVHQVFLYDRGGANRIGRLSGTRVVRWNRERDAISDATVILDPMSCDNDALDALWKGVGRFEMVIFRNEIRVWEGPITRVTWKATSVEVTAHDVCHYAARTAMRNAYDNRYSTENSKVAPVTERMRIILTHELARKEALNPPINVLPFLDVRTSADTANTGRFTPPYFSSVWEEMDHMGARLGLDYVAVGRRILLNDVHEVIGRTPMLTDSDFMSELIVTSYGMELATLSAVTDGEGRYAVVGGVDDYYGEVELIHTLYGEGGDFEDPDNPTEEELAALATEMRSQAQRNLAGRYPTPTVVRVPDGTRLNPLAPVAIEQLVPGVRVPVRATRLRIALQQEQKLDKITVEETDKGETISVKLSPVPGSTPWDDSTETSGDEEEEG